MNVGTPGRCISVCFVPMGPRYFVGRWIHKDLQLKICWHSLQMYYLCFVQVGPMFTDGEREHKGLQTQGCCCRLLVYNLSSGEVRGRRLA